MKMLNAKAQQMFLISVPPYSDMMFVFPSVTLSAVFLKACLFAVVAMNGANAAKNIIYMYNSIHSALITILVLMKGKNAL